MAVMNILFGIVILLLVINIVVSVRNRPSPVQGKPDTNVELHSLKETLKDVEHSLRSEIAQGRSEIAQSSKDLREEVGRSLNGFVQTFSEHLERLVRMVDDKLTAVVNVIDKNNKANREELREALDSFKVGLNEGLKDYKEKLREYFNDFEKNQRTQNVANTEKLEGLKRVLETSIKNLQEGNERKLEEMRNTVDEKLQKTLEARLSQSFELVSKNLESVQKGLGEMQQLAVGVGDLKKVLSNVKTRGILGEVQLSNILEQLLAPDQYDINVITNKSTNNRVEFAIKIPQQSQANKVILMPIDSKFPLEDYYKLVEAYDKGDIIASEAYGKALESAIRKSARDIHEKYICPPDTTEIGLLFLPVEGLYAEVVRRSALVETLQRDYQIIVTGPTTLSAILNTISFGYRTMAMEQRSGEIKKTLSAVKTEFAKFGDVLKKAQERINRASADIDELVGARTRKIQSTLKSFEELPSSEATLLIESAIEPEDDSVSDMEKNSTKDGLDAV